MKTKETTYQRTKNRWTKVIQWTKKTETKKQM